MKRIIFIGILGVGILFGCNSEGTPGAWKEHNLLRYDLPVRVMGPDSVKVTSNNLLFSKGIQKTSIFWWAYSRWWSGLYIFDKARFRERLPWF